MLAPVAQPVVEGGEGLVIEGGRCVLWRACRAGPASPTLRTAYEEAIGKLRPRIPVAPAGQTRPPDKIDCQHLRRLLELLP